jgi:sugar phosphate isomerase/epimerase
MSDDEVDYCFQVAKAVGARGITCEPPVSETRRLGQFAEKHKMMIGYHGHSNVSSPESFGRPGAWEQAFFYSKWNGANIDVGHFAAGNSVPATDFIKRYHDRITNLHLKDRKFNEGENVPWGQGDSQVKEILQLMKREKYPFMATIELEYRIPEGSDTMTELAKCIQFCKDALA